MPEILKMEMKRDSMNKIYSLLAMGVCMSFAISSHASDASWKQAVAAASNEYIDQVYMRYQPTQGTLAGYHQYDPQLEDYSRKNIDAEIVALKVFEKRIVAIHPDSVADDFEHWHWTY